MLRKLRISAMLLVVANLFLLQPSLANQVGAPDDSVLLGDAALLHLQTTGDFKSLSQAVSAARHAIRPVESAQEKELWTPTPAHGLRSRFNTEGLHIDVVTPESNHYSSRVRLTGVGYGDSLQLVESGQLQSHANKVSIEREWVNEWFINKPTGLEHGFTLPKKLPLADEQRAGLKLRLMLALDGDLTPRASEDGTAVALHNKAGKSILQYVGLRAWDAEGKTVNALMRTQGQQIVFHIDDEQASYPLTIDPTFTQQAYLKASNTGPGDNFGYSVAIDGDTAVIGARQEDSNATGVNGEGTNNLGANSGAAFVFVRDSTTGTWSQQAYLKASNTGNTDWFGFAVSIDGDTIVVGAPYEDSISVGVDGDQGNGLVDAGAAYVFTRSAGIWSQQAYLKASNSGNRDEFGYTVAVQGDTVAIGARNEESDSTGVNGDQANDNATQSGAAYVFGRNAGVWSQQAYLKAWNTEVQDHFGASIDIDGETIVVGAPDEDGVTLTNSGAAYIFTRSSGVWSQQEYLKASIPHADDNFGIAVSLAGDSTVIGANSFDTQIASNVGAAYIFDRNAGNWSQQAVLQASNADSGDYFGGAVAIDGDMLLVGATLEDSASTGIDGDQSDNSASFAGAAYVFNRSGNSWIQSNYLKASNTETRDEFGNAVAIDEDAYGGYDPSDRYRVYAGANYGSDEWTNSSNIAWDQRTYPISGWTASDHGRTVWVRFLWRKSGVWKRTNHSYVAGFGPALIAEEEIRPVPVGE